MLGLYVALAGLELQWICPVSASRVQGLQAFVTVLSVHYAFRFTSKNVSRWAPQYFGDKDRRDESLKSVYLKRKGEKAMF